MLLLVLNENNNFYMMAKQLYRIQYMNICFIYNAKNLTVFEAEHMQPSHQNMRLLKMGIFITRQH